MGLSNILRDSLGSAAVSLESHKLDGDVTIGAPQTLITLKDALMSAEEDIEASSFVDEEIAEFETVTDSLENLQKINAIYIRDGGMTPELASVYSQTFDRLTRRLGIENTGISKVSVEAFALDPLVASMEAAEETEKVKTGALEKMFTKSKLFAVKLGDYLSSYSRIANNVKAAAEEALSNVPESAEVPNELIGAWKSFKNISKRMTEFTNRTRLEVDSMKNSAKSGEYHRGEYKAVFEALSKGFTGETIPGGQFTLDSAKAVMRFKRSSSDLSSTTSMNNNELKKLLKDVIAAAEFIGNYSALLKDVESDISKSIVAAERQLGTKLSQSFIDYIHDINAIMRCVRGPGPDYLGYVGNLSRDTIAAIK